MNNDYHIRRENMLAALGMKELSREQTETLLFRDVRVTVGHAVSPSPNMGPAMTLPVGMMTLPVVLIFPPGHTANRIRVGCPKCGKIVRFCALQQHVDTKACQKFREQDEQEGR